MPSAVHNKKETPSSQSRSTNKKQEQVVVSSTKGMCDATTDLRLSTLIVGGVHSGP